MLTWHALIDYVRDSKNVVCGPPDVLEGSQEFAKCSSEMEIVSEDKTRSSDLFFQITRDYL